MQNLIDIKALGIRAFVKKEAKKWKCVQCGELLCVHRPQCLHCGVKNKYFPK